MNDFDCQNKRILIVDDNEAIHADFKKILINEQQSTEALDSFEADLFDAAPSSLNGSDSFEIDSAYQGQEGLELIRASIKESRPYAMAFVDVRMPPGWDGVETVRRIWQEYPDLQVVICTAFSDYSWDEMVKALGKTDNLLILKKPFDPIEVRQFACALTKKWQLNCEVQFKVADLEETVEERTRKIKLKAEALERVLSKLQQTYDQLNHSEKMAAVGVLASGVAHEINNPMAFIRCNLKTLDDYAWKVKRILSAYEQAHRECLETHKPVTPKTEALRQELAVADIDYIVSDIGSLVSECSDGADRVFRIVEDLREFSEADKVSVEKENIHDLLDMAINLVRRELEYKAELILDFKETLPPISCHAGKLVQIFLNMLINSAQAIDKKGTITIRTGSREGVVWIEIADTGCGISPENLNRIFEPFFTTKEVGTGTGLGLHLAYNIITAHGGKISVKSNVGSGSVFHVELPY